MTSMRLGYARGANRGPRVGAQSLYMSTACGDRRHQRKESGERGKRRERGERGRERKRGKERGRERKGRESESERVKEGEEGRERERGDSSVARTSVPAMPSGDSGE